MDGDKMCDIINTSVKELGVNDDRMNVIKSNIERLEYLIGVKCEDCIIDVNGDIWIFTNQSIVKSIVGTGKSYSNNIVLFPYNSIVKISITDSSENGLTMHVALSNNNEDVQIEVMNKLFRIELLRIYKEKFL